MDKETFDRIGTWVWGASLMLGIALMLRPLPHSADAALSLFPQADTVFHFSFFLYLQTLPQLTQWGRSKRFRIALGLILFGLALEALQAFTSYRTASLSDAVANTAGVIVGSAISRLFGDEWRRRNG